MLNTAITIFAFAVGNAAFGIMGGLGGTGLARVVFRTDRRLAIVVTAIGASFVLVSTLLLPPSIPVDVIAKFFWPSPLIGAAVAWYLVGFRREGTQKGVDR